MDITTVETTKQAWVVLKSSTEREVLKAALYMILPQDGSALTNDEIVPRIHDMVDPIHSVLKKPSKSYTGLEPNGRRRRHAINATAQWFGPGSSVKRNGNHWIALDNGSRYYIGNGAQEANRFFDEPDQRLIIEALIILGLV